MSLFTAEAAGIAAEIVALRRELHQIPETGLECPRTQARILAALDGLGLEVTTGEACSFIAPAVSRKKQAMQNPMLPGFPSAVSSSAARPVTTPVRMTIPFFRIGISFSRKI